VKTVGSAPSLREPQARCFGLLHHIHKRPHPTPGCAAAAPHRTRDCSAGWARRPTGRGRRAPAGRRTGARATRLAISAGHVNHRRRHSVTASAWSSSRLCLRTSRAHPQATCRSSAPPGSTTWTATGLCFPSATSQACGPWSIPINACLCGASSSGAIELFDLRRQRAFSMTSRRRRPMPTSPGAFR